MITLQGYLPGFVPSGSATMTSIDRERPQHETTPRFPAERTDRLGPDRHPLQRGTTSTSINGAVRGDECTDSVLNARGGQTMLLSLAVTGTNVDGSALLKILAAGKDDSGPGNCSSDDDGRDEITVPCDGDCATRAYLMGAAPLPPRAATTRLLK